jgi:HEAT repeat protein
LLILLLAFAAGPSRASPEGMLEQGLRDLRAEGKDLAVRTDRWPTAMSLPFVDGLLADPAAAREKMDRLWRRIEGAGAASELFKAALGPLGMQAPNAPRPGLGGAVSGLENAASRAQVLLDKAVSSLQPGTRERLLEMVRACVSNGDPDIGPGDFDALARFDLGSLAEAASLLIEAAEAALPELRRIARDGAPKARERRGLVLVSGTGDDAYSQEDLSGVKVLVDLGGDNRYLAAPAAASAGELRLVIDLGASVSVETSSPSAGSGTLGIGLMFLPNPKGRKSLKGGDFSHGAGLLGVGGLFLGGPSDVSSGRFAQGAGAFGIGMLSSQGEGSSFCLRLGGQGFGFTRGAGIFRHQGGRAALDGGRSEADPRDALAALSLSQGAGYGPRARAAGGMGLAFVEGSSGSLKASYMAQGMGYWRSLGGLLVKGGGNSIEGRRYAQGAGVHSGFGAFRIEGDGNRAVNWGAGPALGWDYGVGLAIVDGDGNSLSSEWASARGDVNGHGIALVSGRDNRLALKDAGSGFFKRGGPGYGVLAASGGANAFALSLSTPAPGADRSCDGPWGIVRGLDFRPLAPERGEWPAVDHGPAFLADRRRVGGLIEAARGKSPAEAIPLLLRAAASSGHDGEGGRLAARLLASLPDEEAGRLASLADPGDFEEWMWLGLLLPGFGRAASSAILRELASSDGMRKVLLMGLLRTLPVREAAPEALKGLSDPDWRLRRASAGALAGLIGRQRGQEPGRVRLLETARRICDGRPDPGWVQALGDQRLGDLYGALSIAGASAPGRASLLDSAQRPFEPAGPGTYSEFERLLSSSSVERSRALAAELSGVEAWEARVLSGLRGAFDDPEPEVADAALGGVSAAGREEDAGLIAGFLEHPAALLREAAASGLGRMGPAGKKAIEAAARSASARTRSLAAVAASQTFDPAVLDSLRLFLDDADAGVRRTALDALLSVQAPMRARRASLKAAVEARLGDPDPNVRAAASRALDSIGN